MDGGFQCWISLQVPRDYLHAREPLETAGVGLIAGRGEFLQKFFCHQRLSLQIFYAAMAPCCNG
jgi:hypothetical protein